ncbi:MAG: response regulator [Candidatus Nealsonbacteria bacterium CG08_land_8_20_14_0_20_43_11]|uniref:Response regulator n=1 Tax=Candidatus Nealsonbacteria bacterium CG08_land_8_20_14_0_20_43_11 TaxID=1974706 RepID=A0A2M6T0H7_9BACT|nr:MAG: response regulator [Candidatus Nealsonbacteria bacterium CG08_land_8_20_14_0_20_43_11]
MPKKILIIEDETIMLNLLRRKLLGDGYEVYSAGDGEEGLEKMKEVKPDLVLLDIVMPKLSGIEVLERLQTEKEIKDIPIIVISNSGQPVEIDKAKKLGAKDWLVKTEFDPREVREKVEKQIGPSSESK